MTASKATSSPKRRIKNRTEYNYRRRVASPCVDYDGRPIMRIKMNTGQYIRMLRDEFDKLWALGFLRSCYANPDGKGRFYPCTMAPERASTNASIARLIMQPKEKQRVRFRDGDRLNLRSDNLQVVGGASKGFERGILEGRKADDSED